MHELEFTCITSCNDIYFLTQKAGCEYLEDIDYGKVEHDGTHVGAKATYTCDYGYKLVGYSVRKCQYNGYWSGKEPKCHRKYK